jgi:hypothetical protein
MDKTIVITWMDSNVGVYENASASVLNGVLHIHLHRVNEVTGIKTLTGTWHFPISNIRAWGPEEWGGQHGILQPGVFDQKEG